MDFLLERMTRQGLSGRAPQGVGSAAQVAASAVGLQAQDAAAARLGVRARSSGVDEAAVVEAGEVRRRVVRT